MMTKARHRCRMRGVPECQERMAYGLRMELTTC